MGTRRALALVAATVLLMAACGSDDDDAAADEQTTTTEATDETTTSDGSSGDDGSCSDSQVPSASSYAVTGIADDDPDGGLVARQLPGADEDEIDVLPEGTVVDASSDADACAVTSDGAVWWNIGTPQLATGGWVNSKFLTAGTSPPDTGQDSYDLEKTQIACIYDGDDGACDILELDGYSAQGNYGLGNSYSMAPDDAIAEQCSQGDQIACAEQESRK